MPDSMSWFTILAKLPGTFSQFSFEMLQEMVFDKDLGYTSAKVDMDGRSPRQIMVELLKKERDGAIEVFLHLLQEGDKQ